MDHHLRGFTANGINLLYFIRIFFSASDAVISMCGHLFCWPCLHQWLETRPQRQICPVCKAGIGRDKVVPLYGRDGDNKDPRDKPIPPRYSDQF